MSKNPNEIEDSVIYRYIGYAAIPLRLVLGWMFFSAAWRRVVLASGKLQPNSPLWVGHKFNTFLPHASNFMGVGSLIHLLILHPQGLAVFLNVFTVIEFLVGLSLIFGLFLLMGRLISAFAPSCITILYLFMKALFTYLLCMTAIGSFSIAF